MSKLISLDELIPANPALVVTRNPNAPEGNFLTELSMGSEALDLTDRINEAKKQVYGDREVLSEIEIVEIFSRVCATSAEFAFFLLSTGRALQKGISTFSHSGNNFI